MILLKKTALTLVFGNKPEGRGRFFHELEKRKNFKIKSTFFQIAFLGLCVGRTTIVKSHEVM
jgi:hypothetical protein